MASGKELDCIPTHQRIGTVLSGGHLVSPQLPTAVAADPSKLLLRPIAAWLTILNVALSVGKPLRFFLCVLLCFLREVCDVRTQSLRRRNLLFLFQLRDACVHPFCGHRRMRSAGGCERYECGKRELFDDRLKNIERNRIKDIHLW